MSSNQLKTPLAFSLDRFAQAKVNDALQLTGKALPASVVSRVGSIVVVKFEITSLYTLPEIQIPLAGSQYIRLPIQPGCMGVVRPTDTRIGNVSGLGSGTPGLDAPANLSSLVFEPVGNINFTPVDDTSVVIYATPACVLSVSPTGVTVAGSAGQLSAATKVAAPTLEASGAATGTFTSQDGKHITVVKGIITMIVLGGGQGMRTYGRVTNPNGTKSWVEVSTDANGADDYVWLTTLAQVLKLAPQESPFYANYGIPAQRSVIQQVFPDYYVVLTQMQFASRFASLQVARLPAPNPVYQINVTTNQGVVMQASVAT